MPSYSKLFLKPFIGGLNTEVTNVEDLTLNTADELNCTILPEALRGRRYGFNIERDGTWIAADETASYSGYLWKNVNKTSRSFIVQQVDTVLKFYQAETKPLTLKDASNNLVNYIDEIDISTYVVSSLSNGIGPLNYTIGDGDLFVVNSNIKPLRIIYNEEENSEDNQGYFSLEPFDLYIRDLDGIEDGLEVDEMPLGSTSTSDLYNGLTNEHHYNLLNQGWDDIDLIKFVQNKAHWPSNNLQWFIGKDDSGIYNTDILLKKYFGNTPAPKGHFIINYFSQNRSDVSGIFGVSARTGKYDYQRTWIRHRKLRGIEINNFTARIWGAENEQLRSVILRFTKLYRRSSKKHGSNDWSGRVHIQVRGYSGQTKYAVFQKRGFSSSVITATSGSSKEQHFMKSKKYKFLGFKYVETDRTVLAEDEIQVYGAAPNNPVLRRITFNNSTNYVAYDVYVWFTNGNNQGHSGEKNPFGVTCNVYGYVEGENTDIFPTVNATDSITDITYMGNRLFYLVNDSVLFSQSIGSNGKGFEKCYQDADPTSEEIPDIVATDGGIVKFNNIGVGRALETFNRGVLVFGDNIVYGLISPVEKVFTATEYDILELSRAGIAGARSIVSTDDMVYYWSPLGIFRIGINPNTGTSIIAQSITNTTIQTFYNNIPATSKQYCRGVFDYVANRIYWYYPSTDDYKKLDMCLVYDITYNCFMPFKIGNVLDMDEDDPDFREDTSAFIADVFQTNIVYEIEPTVYLKAGGNNVIAGTDKVIVKEESTNDFHRWTAIQHIVVDGATNAVSFGDYNDREFRDFNKTVFDAYMISRPITLDDTFYNKQTPVLQTLFKRTEEDKLNEYNYTPSLENIPYALTPWFTYTYFKSQPSYYTYMFVNVSPLIGNPSKFLSGGVTVDANSIPNDIAGASKPFTTRAELRGFMDCGTYYNPEGYDIVASAEQEGTKKNLTLILQPTVHASKKYDRYELYTILDCWDYHVPANVITKFPKQWNPEGSVAHIIMTDVDTSNGIFDSTKKEYATKDVYAVDRAGIYNSDGVKGAKANVVKGYVAGYNVNCNPVWYYAPHPTEWNATVSARMPRPDDKYKVKTQLVSNDSNRFGYPSISLGNPTILHTEKSLMYTDKICFDDESDFPQMNFTGTVTTIVPVLQEPEKIELNTAKYTFESGAYIRMRWGWSLNDKSNRWDMIQNGYRPQKDFLYDEYVESRLHIRGRGKAFQIEIRNDENKDMRLAGLNIIIRSK